MVSGPYIKGKVVKLSPVVEVLESPYGDRKGGKLRRFCGDGTQSDGKRGNRHPEFGSWRLDDMPFEERTAKILNITGNKPRTDGTFTHFPGAAVP
jgi:hypothetical protein